MVPTDDDSAVVSIDVLVNDLENIKKEDLRPHIGHSILF